MAQATANMCVVRPPKQNPPKDSRRPPEPARPAEAHKAGISLMAARARRRRFRRIPPTYW